MKLLFQRKIIRFLLQGIFLFLILGFKTDTYSLHIFTFLKYNVEMQDKVVGWMSSTKTISSDNTELKFKIDSKVNVDIITRVEVNYTLESTFRDNYLHFSRLINIVNSDTQNYTRLQWDGIRYNTWDGKRNKYLDDQKIIYSVGCLYFREPVGLTNLFSEKFLTFCPITKNGEYYSISFPDGSKTIYKYQNGICVWVETKQRLFKIIFRLKEIH